MSDEQPRRRGSKCNTTTTTTTFLPYRHAPPAESLFFPHQHYLTEYRRLCFPALLPLPQKNSPSCSSLVEKPECLERKKRKQVWRHSSRYLLQQHQHQHQQQQLASAIVTKLMYTSRKYLGKSSTTADFLYCHDIHIVKGGGEGGYPVTQVPGKEKDCVPVFPVPPTIFLHLHVAQSGSTSET